MNIIFPIGHHMNRIRNDQMILKCQRFKSRIPFGRNEVLRVVLMNTLKIIEKYFRCDPAEERSGEEIKELMLKFNEYISKKI